MKLTKINGILLVLNLTILGGTLYFHFSKTDSGAPASKPTIASAREPHTVLKVPAPQIITVTNQFQWAQLESEDYRTYVTRLRSIGCPEQTIRDIIIADLDKLIAPRVQGIYGRRQDLKFWHPEEEEQASNFDHREWTKQERDLDREKRQVIQDLLGIDLVRERLKLKGQTDYYERRLSFLPEDKRSQMRSLLEKYEEQEQQIRDKEWENGSLPPADKSELKKIQEQRQEEISKALSPAEREQLELWTSPAANSVRHSVYGMNASEAEFMAIYKARKNFEQTWGQQDAAALDEASRQKWTQAQAQMEEQIKQSLGEKRYADYQRGEDDDFHHLNATVSRYKLPRERATEVYELKKTAIDMQSAVRVDPTIPPEQKQSVLKSMGEETERTIKQLLGEKAYHYYLRRGQGQWIQG